MEGKVLLSGSRRESMIYMTDGSIYTLRYTNDGQALHQRETVMIQGQGFSFPSRDDMISVISLD